MSIIAATPEFLSYHVETSTYTLWQYIFMYRFCVLLIEKEGLVNGAGYCGMLGILLIVEPSVASRTF